MDLTGYSRSAESEYLTTVGLSATVEDAVRLVRRAMTLQYANIVTSVREDAYVNARTSELKQVLVNLIKNAVESVEECERPGEVRVSAWMDDEGVHITVADEGAGIPEGQGDVLFDPFFTTKAPGKGTGLGLNIVYRIVTKYRGTITGANDRSGGARFTLRFPKD